MNSTLDWLRPYTAPRALLVGLFFLISLAFRVAVLLPALLVHLGDRAADRLIRFADLIPPAPIRLVTRPTQHGPRGRKQR